VSLYLGGTTPSALEPKFQNLWYGFGVFSPETYAKVPNSLVIVTLVSNFGTFMLYMMTCIVAMVAFREHKSFNGFKHLFIPLFGLVANLLLHAFLPGGTVHGGGNEREGAVYALGACAVWGVYGAVYFLRNSKAKARAVMGISRWSVRGRYQRKETVSAGVAPSLGAAPGSRRESLHVAHQGSK